MNLREPRPGVSVFRRIAIPGGIGLAVVAALVIAIGLGGGGNGAGLATPVPSDDQAAAPLITDLPMVTVPPTASPGSSATAFPSPSATATASPGVGIVANHITIARLGIDLPIVEGDGIDTPIGKAAHFPGTAWPGGGSNIYLYGHARTGMFIGLWKARVGDRIELGLVDGTTRTYVVTKILSKVAWNALHYLDPTPTEQLSLQTCTSYGQTAPRFIVIAVPAT
jgi:LPXTG-site transpeptidase (sortase) family protein